MTKGVAAIAAPSERGEMTITLTEHDRKLLIKRLLEASESENAENIVTILHITEIYSGHQEE